jgi:uncharacterized coiled-coil protein SlyX
MTDERGPVFRRARSHQDRDHYVSKATPASGIPAETFDDPTGQCSGEQLARARSRRPTPERISRLEAKHDELAETVTEIRIGVGKMSGQLDTLVQHVLADRKEVHATERTRIATTPNIIKAIGAAIALVIAALLGKGVL